MSRQFVRHSKKGDYMPVPDCPTMNLLTAIIDDYKRSPKRLKTIFLSRSEWRRFVDDCKRIDESYPVDAVRGVPIDNSDVTIKCGSVMLDSMRYEFYTDIELKPENYLKSVATA